MENKFKVVFEYDTKSCEWEVKVFGAKDSEDALEGFNAVILTSRLAIPDTKCNKADLQKDGSYYISIGQMP